MVILGSALRLCVELNGEMLVAEATKIVFEHRRPFENLSESSKVEQK